MALGASAAVGRLGMAPFRRTPRRSDGGEVPGSDIRPRTGRPVRRRPFPAHVSADSLRLVRTEVPRPKVGGGIWFVLVVFLVLAAGVAGLLALTTTASQDSFTLNRLQQEQAALRDKQQALARSLLGEASPVRLARRARALGLHPAQTVRVVHKGRHHSAYMVLAAPTPSSKPAAVAKPVVTPSMKPTVTPTHRAHTATKRSTRRTPHH